METSGVWSKVYSAQHGTFYYYNNTTQESTWTQPADWKPQAQSQQQKPQPGYGAGAGNYAAYGKYGAASSYGTSHAGASSGGSSNAKVFVGGLSFDTTDQSLGAFCSTVGTVRDVKVIMDRESGRSKGYGFVTFSSDAEAARAIGQLNGQQLDGRSIRINNADNKGSSSGGHASTGATNYSTNQHQSARDSGRGRDSPRDQGDRSRDERRRSRSRSRDRRDDQRGSAGRNADDLSQIRGTAAQDKGFSQKNFQHSNSIYVTGLPPSVTADALEKTFKIIGVIKLQKVGRNRWDTAPKIKIYKDDNGVPKGDAVITYEDPSSAQAAPKFFHDREVDIHGLGKFKLTCQVNAKQEAPPRSSQQSYGRQGGAHGGGRGGDNRGYGGRSGGHGNRGGYSGGNRSGGNVRPGDWLCPACSANNFASKTACFKCGVPKPGGAGHSGGYPQRGGYDGGRSGRRY